MIYFENNNDSIVEYKFEPIIKNIKFKFYYNIYMYLYKVIRILYLLKIMETCKFFNDFFT